MEYRLPRCSIGCLDAPSAASILHRLPRASRDIADISVRGWRRLAREGGADAARRGGLAGWAAGLRPARGRGAPDA